MGAPTPDRMRRRIHAVDNRRYPLRTSVDEPHARHLPGRVSQVPLPTLKHFRLGSNLSVPIRLPVDSPEHRGIIGCPIDFEAAFAS